MPHPAILLALALLASSPRSSPGQTAPVRFDSATGYRVDSYRAVVPRPPPDVLPIATRDVKRLHAAGAVLIDVMPAQSGGRDAATGAQRAAQPRRTIPGAHWFPEAGRGHLAPGIESGFLRGVATLAGGDATRTIVVFCVRDCWMGWNAALRLKRAGYGNVRWFADGTDGWRKRGWPLVPATPYAPAPPTAPSP